MNVWTNVYEWDNFSLDNSILYFIQQPVSQILGIIGDKHNYILPLTLLFDVNKLLKSSFRAFMHLHLYNLRFRHFINLISIIFFLFGFVAVYSAQWNSGLMASTCNFPPLLQVVSSIPLHLDGKSAPGQVPTGSVCYERNGVR